MRVTRSDQLMDELEKRILQMEPGEKLPTEIELSEQYNVGRSTIREILKVLSYKKLIIRRNEGTFVAENISDYLVDPLNLIVNMSVGNVGELMELREMLEMMAVRLGVRRATEEDIANLERVNWLIREPGLTDEQKQARDVEFHNELANCAKNHVMAQLLSSARQVIIQNVEASPKDIPSALMDKGVEWHEKIIQAIKDRDEEVAVRLMEEYLIAMDNKA